MSRHARENMSRILAVKAHAVLSLENMHRSDLSSSGHKQYPAPQLELFTFTLKTSKIISKNYSLENMTLKKSVLAFEGHDTSIHRN